MANLTTSMGEISRAVKKLPKSSKQLTKLLFRLICSLSMQRLKQHVPVRREPVLPWWPTK